MKITLSLILINIKKESLSWCSKTGSIPKTKNINLLFEKMMNPNLIMVESFSLKLGRENLISV